MFPIGSRGKCHSGLRVDIGQVRESQGELAAGCRAEARAGTHFQGEGHKAFQGPEIRDCLKPISKGDRLLGARDLSERGGRGREEGASSGRPAQPCNVPPQNVQWIEARGVCDKAIEENESVAKAWFRRGEAHLALNDCESAKADFEKTFQLDPENKAAKNKITHC